MKSATFLALFAATAFAANVARQDVEGGGDVAVDVTATGAAEDGAATGAADIDISDPSADDSAGDASDDASPSGVDAGGDADASADVSGGVSPPEESAPAEGGAAAAGLTWSAAVGLVAYMI